MKTTELMKKPRAKFYCEYLEDSPPQGFEYGDGVMRFIDFFKKGPAIGPGDGFKRKKDLLGFIARTNAGIGREVVRVFDGGAE